MNDDEERPPVLTAPPDQQEKDHAAAPATTQQVDIYLQALHFDELFEPIDDVELIIFIVNGNVARVQPTVRINHLFRSFGVVVIAFHHLGSEDAQLALLTRAQSFARVNVDNFGAGPRNWLAT